MTGGGPANGLVRAIGRWGLTALMVNAIIGGGIFGLPSIVGRLLGPLSPWAWLAAALGVGLIMACGAEVASQFAEAGGPYLYARVAYGQFAGIQIAWLAWLARLASSAANANIFVDYLPEFLPRAHGQLSRVVVLVILIGGLAAVNIVSVRLGAATSGFFAAGKLVPLLILIVAGLVLPSHTAEAQAFAATTFAPGLRRWLQALLLLVFACGGFEVALYPMGEARNARRDVPVAILSSLLICTGVYVLIQVAVLRALGPTPASDRPLAEAAHVLLGTGGAALMSAGALLSIYGLLSSQMLNVPRLTFALAERGDFPSIFQAVCRSFRTPWFSIAAFAIITFALALIGTFQWNAALSAVARLLTYGVVCATLITLRHRNPRAEAFRLPAGTLIAALGLAFALLLVTQMGRLDLLVIAGSMAIAFMNWLWARRRTASGQHSFRATPP